MLRQYLGLIWTTCCWMPDLGFVPGILPYIAGSRPWFGHVLRTFQQRLYSAPLPYPLCISRTYCSMFPAQDCHCTYIPTMVRLNQNPYAAPFLCITSALMYKTTPRSRHKLEITFARHTSVNTSAGQSDTISKYNCTVVQHGILERWLLSALIQWSSVCLILERMRKSHGS